MWVEEYLTATKLFNAASIAPAPAPNGRASKINHQNELERENPKSETVETQVLTKMDNRCVAV